MLYLLDKPLSLVTYHVSQRYQREWELELGVEPKDLNRYLIKGSPNKTLINVISLKSEQFPSVKLKQSKRNITYLVFTKKIPKEWLDWADIKEWVEYIDLNPRTYATKLDKYKKIFTQEAYDWFWYKFRYYPKKMDGEINTLLLWVNKNKTPITLEFLENKYNHEVNNDLFNKFIKYLGTKTGTKTLIQMKSYEIWRLLVGQGEAPPIIYNKLVCDNGNESIYNALQIYQELALSGDIDVKLGAIVFHNWLIDIIDRSPARNWRGLSIFMDHLYTLENLIN